jgi:hypothetical protein
VLMAIHFKIAVLQPVHFGREEGRDEKELP